MLDLLPLDVLVVISKLDCRVGRALHLAIRRLVDFTREVGKTTWYRVDRNLNTYIRMGDELRLHSFDDEPAVVWAFSLQEWYQDWFLDWYNNGIIQKPDDQSTLVSQIRGQAWYRCGQRHRDHDQPAVVRSDNHMEWYRNGRLHRDHDQPALIYATGRKECYWYGRLQDCRYEP